MHAHDALVRLVLVWWKSAHLPFGGGAVWLETATLFCGLGSVFFTDEESGILWEDTLFELHSSGVWSCRAVPMRGHKCSHNSLI